jgi:chromo domain-containing protein 1
LKAAVDSVWKLNFEDMFASNDGGENVNLVERRAFVISHPEDHFREIDIITRWLLVHHVQVGSANYPGAWADFAQQIQQGGSGIVIVRNA